MRLLRPSLIVFSFALLLSLAIHLPVYEVLGALARRFFDEEAHKPPPAPVEFEIGPDVAKPTKAPKASARAESKPRSVAKPREEPEHPRPAPVAEAKPATAPPPPTAPHDRPLAVTQKSDDPNAPPPDQARFISDENRRVAEETVARVRNSQRDDQVTQPQAEPSKPSQDTGDAERAEAADLRDQKGSRERTASPTEAQQVPDHPSETSAGKREAPALPHPAAERSPSPPARGSGPPVATEPDTIVVQDDSGSFTIRRHAPGPIARNGETSERTPGNQGPGSNTSGATTGPNLRMAWSQFEEAFGSDQLAQEREAFLEQHRSRAAGGAGERQRMWREFRSAIENYVPEVKPGTQTALNAAADPFAQYLADVHRRIHREFAEGFLRGLPLVGGPYGDLSLHTELEIVISGDGTVHRVGIAQSSGFLPFDYGAFNAVMRGAPYATPPRKILSGDGRVYFHWGFYRNERQCGTFNAQPYILPHPQGTPKNGGSDELGHPAPKGPAPRPAEGELGARSIPAPRNSA